MEPWKKTIQRDFNYKKVIMKQLISLISTKGKTVEQIAKEFLQSIKKFDKAREKAKKEFKIEK